MAIPNHTSLLPKGSFTEPCALVDGDWRFAIRAEAA
jgi:hypothetical protein